MFRFEFTVDLMDGRYRALCDWPWTNEEGLSLLKLRILLGRKTTTYHRFRRDFDVSLFTLICVTRCSLAGEEFEYVCESVIHAYQERLRMRISPRANFSLIIRTLSPITSWCLITPST